MLVQTRKRDLGTYTTGARVCDGVPVVGGVIWKILYCYIGALENTDV
jgi:hypothetical protein